jgi:hypothetical protein
VVIETTINIEATTEIGNNSGNIVEGGVGATIEI